MNTYRKRKILEAMSRSLLLEMAQGAGIAGLTGKSKQEIVGALTSAKAFRIAEVLNGLKRDELKAICRSLDLDDSGKLKSDLIARLMGEEARIEMDGSDGMTDGAEGQPKTTRDKTMAPYEQAEPMGKGKEISQYDHKGKQRLNNPPVGLVNPDTDKGESKKQYAYDPHLDPQLAWAGKAEHLSFDVDTVSLHVHERIDPLTIIEAVRKRAKGLQVGEDGGSYGGEQGDMFFDQPSERPPLREAIEFYKHAHNWSNRLIAGDSLLVMNSLLEKEGMAGKVQMVYIDPPYGIKYGSNFQPFVNKRDVKDGKDEDLSQEPETIRAFRDTWELGIHSYLTYLRDRLLLAKELMNESGSCFVQISDENLHHVRELMDEVFGPGNLCGLITFVKASAQTSFLLSSASDYIVWYCRDRKIAKYRQLYLSKEAGQTGASNYTNIESPDGADWRRMSKEERDDITTIPEGWRIFSLGDLMGTRPPNPTDLGPFEWNGKVYNDDRRKCWKTDESGLRRLGESGRLMESGNGLYYKRYIDDFPVYPMTTNWGDTASSFMADKVYVVQTTVKVIQRCLLMTTDPGDLVLDPTCGSGTTAYVAERWGRRWITCDTSRVAITLAKQRLMTANFEFYKLAHPPEGVGSGFVYERAPHITLKSIANNPEIREGMPKSQIDYLIQKYAEQETLYDKPEVDRSKARVSGPFTVEAVPAPAVKALTDVEAAPPSAGDGSISRSGETLRQDEWRAELLKTGVRAKSGRMLEFSRIEPLAGTRWLQAEGETKGEKPQRAVVSFGPTFAPLEQRQVELAYEEARTLKPTPTMLLFAAFQFDPEAAKDIDELTPEKTGMTFLKIQMNTDLLTEDLKKKRSGNQSFWMIGQPDVEVRPCRKKADKGKYEVELQGFDYYNPITGIIESGDASRIAVWMLDTDYDGRSLFPRQVFFPMAGDGDGWAKLAKTLRAEIDTERIEAYRGKVSLPFEPGEHRRVAVKIVDDRGIESLKIVGID